MIVSNCNTKVLNPKEIEFKFEITFTLGEWKKIKSHLDKDWQYPMSELADSINSCVSQAEQVFVPKPKSNNPAV